MSGPSLLVANAGLAVLLLGLILTIQLVHYPSFSDVDAASFPEFHRLHELRISPLVGPLMVLEALAAVALVVTRPASVPAWMAWTAAGLVALIWAATFFVSVPIHGQLHGGFDAERIAALVRTNWIRTAAWAGRSGILGLALVRSLS